MLVRFFVLLSLGIFTTNVSAEEKEISLESGANVYAKYCMLCHGSQGMGEGMLPTSVKDYPNTNLHAQIKLNSREELFSGIAYGHNNTESIEIDPLMPPWKEELTVAELRDVVDFVILMRKSTEQSLHYLKAATSAVPVRRSIGQSFFKTRCALCHGESGSGDGRMSKILSPPPANLLTSKLNDEKMLAIIANGGEAVNRSPSMPPWKDQLSTNEIEAIIQYIRDLQNNADR